MSTVSVAGSWSTPPDRGIPRPVEAILAALGLVLALPLLAVCAVAIAVSSRGPILFRQERVGKLGRFFTLLKFRTMRDGARGPEVTARGDARITMIGTFLRWAKLDELPALWNVLRGDLSLVGPRPEVPRFVDLGNPLWRRVLRVRPGLTDPVTIALRNEEELLASVGTNREAFYRDVLQPYKLKGYCRYLDRRDWWTDLGVIARTLVTIIAPGRSKPPTIADLQKDAEQPFDEPPRPVVSGPPRGFTLRHVQYLLDVLILSGAFVGAYLLRFDFQTDRAEMRNVALQLPYVLVLQVGALIFAGVYRFIWRYVGIREFKRFVEAAVWAGAAMAGMRLFLGSPYEVWRVPLSVIVMDTVLGFGGTLGVRVLRRLAYERGRRGASSEAAAATQRKVLLLGAGQAGVLAAREIMGRGDLDLDIRGFVDDDAEKVGAVIHGIPVLGTTRDLERLVAEHGIQDVVITIAQISRRQILRMMDLCRRIGVSARIIPGLYEILQGKVQVTRIRDVQIEDLLGRERVYLDEQEIGAFLQGKVVAVTGAGGSIGSEMARQVARFKPSSLLLLERAEFALFDIDRDVRRLFPDLHVVPIVADVGDEPWIRSIFAAHHPNVVFHAAAHKHVPMMESNPSEAIKNNVVGTRVVAQAAAEAGVEAFVMISTDKAVRPTSVMGASKRVAELIVQDLARRCSTRFVAVRFGNVMGSAGSVIPIFREQIQRGGPVTVTDPEMKRYFMTIPEAAQLVLQAGAMGRGGEIFILDMGDPVRILDLAVAMINLSGIRPFEDMEIVFTGLRPGEKLFEELELDGEEIAKTRHPKIFIGRIAPLASTEIEKALRTLQRLSRSGDPAAIRSYFNELLPEANLGEARGPATDMAERTPAAAMKTALSLPIVEPGDVPHTPART